MTATKQNLGGKKRRRKKKNRSVWKFLIKIIYSICKIIFYNCLNNYYVIYILLKASTAPCIPSFWLYNVCKIWVVENHSGITSPWPSQESWTSAMHNAFLEHKPVWIIWTASSLCCDITWIHSLSQKWYRTFLHIKVKRVILGYTHIFMVSCLSNFSSYM